MKNSVNNSINPMLMFLTHTHTHTNSAITVRNRLYPSWVKKKSYFTFIQIRSIFLQHLVDEEDGANANLKYTNFETQITVLTLPL